MEDLVQALRNVMEAQAAHDEAFAGYGGYSWGYHGEPLIRDMRDAEKRFADKLGEFVDARIREKLNDYGVIDIGA